MYKGIVKDALFYLGEVKGFAIKVLPRSHEGRKKHYVGIVVATNARIEECTNFYEPLNL